MTSVTFLHTADWQLGMQRHYLGEQQSSFDESRLDAVRSALRQAREAGAEFVLGAGDIFDANALRSTYVMGALDAMREAELPVYLLPGNHDLLEAGTIYRSSRFVRNKPDNVHVIDSTEPITVAASTMLIGVPVVSKFADAVDLDELITAFPDTCEQRIVLLHGGTDAVFSGTAEDGESAADFSVADLDRITTSGGISYVALGDRHSVTQIGTSGKTWYSGSPEVTAFNDVEKDSGKALLVTLDGQSTQVRPLSTGSWKFLRHDAEIYSIDDVAQLKKDLDAVPDKSRTVVKLTLNGTIDLQVNKTLEEFLDDYAGLFANVYVRSASQLVLRPDTLELDRDFSGYARDAAHELAALAERGGARGRIASEALALLYGIVKQEESA